MAQNESNLVALQDALQILGDVSAYLKRLPHVPVTRELINRVDAYLSSPETHTAQRLASEQASESYLRHQIRTAATCSALGLPIIELSVQGDIAKISLGRTHSKYDEDGEFYKSTLDHAMRQLEKGVELVLKSPP